MKRDSEISTTLYKSSRQNQHRQIIKQAAVTIIALIGLGASTAQAASFDGLEYLPGGTSSFAFDVSGDGSTVVGYGSSSIGTQAYYWKSGSGLTGSGVASSTAYGVNQDGSIIVGAGSASSPQAMRWTVGAGVEDIGSIPGIGGFSTAYAVSGNGLTVAGRNTKSFPGGARYDAFRWTQASGMVSLGFLPGVTSNSLFAGANDISADGTVIVGYSRTGTGQEAFRWTQASGMMSLGSGTSAAYAVSSDGNFVVGGGVAGVAFLWNSSAPGILTSLGDLPGDIEHSQAFDVSDNGGIVVGESYGVNGREAFIWDLANGMRSLKDLLVAEGLDLTGWTLTTARGISDDGTVIAGYGKNPSGQNEAWVATLDLIDTDGDGVPDSQDVCPLDPENDADGDGVCGDIDICIGGDDTLNTDGDSLPDFCDVCPLDVANDADGDGICESFDNCPINANPGQGNNDGDAQGDVCDDDDDNDGVVDGVDNCPLQPNDQTDTDNDGAGDECDTDADGDGVLDAVDACLLSPFGEAVNTDGCAVSDLCPCLHPLGDQWKNHGAYVKCVTHTSNDFVDAGLITETDKGEIVSAAGNSACGAKK